MKLRVLKIDIRKAIKARAYEIASRDWLHLGTNVTRYCPIAQALIRNGLSIKAVEYNEVRLDNGKLLDLDEKGRWVTNKSSNLWEELLESTPIEIELKSLVQ